jgi:Ca2+-binding RTX toxin-like protein
MAKGNNKDQKKNQNLKGGHEDEVLIGGPGNDTLRGESGDDLIRGEAGNDTLRGDDGNDDLSGGAGNDNLRGGDGDDLLIYDAALNQGSHDVYDGDKDTDTLRLVLTAQQAADPAIQNEISAFQDSLSGSGTGKGKSNGAFVFHELGLTVREIEILEVEVTGGGSNNPPLAVDDIVSTDEDTTLDLGAGQLTANDSDVDGDSLSITSVSNAVNGSVSLGGGVVSFTPETNFSGTASFEYTISDGQGGSDTALVNITVAPVNDNPQAIDDSAVTNEDTPLPVAPAQLLANDADIDGDSLSVTAVSNAVNGSVELSAGAITFSPDANFNGNASFQYTVSDGSGGTDTATVSLVVNPINDAPVATADTLSTDEDSALVIAESQLINNDSDIDGDALSVSSVGNAQHGSVSLSAGQVIFTPDVNFNGVASFEYTVDDGNGETDLAVAQVNVSPVNDSPSASADAFDTDEDSAIVIANSELLGNDTDIDGDSLSVQAVGGATNGSVSLSAGQVIFTPAINFNGLASFEYTVEDGNGGSDVAIAQITVNAVNDAPIAEDDGYILEEDSVLSLTVAELIANDTDVDFDSLSLTTVDNALNGTVSLTGNSIEFTPDENFHGNASFEYSVTDGNGGTATGTVNIAVTPVNDQPVAVDDVFSADEDLQLVLDTAQLLGNDLDIDGDLLNVTAVEGASNGSVELSGSTVTFTPDPDFNGAASFNYIVDDGQGGSDVANVAIDVGSVNDAPVAADDNFDVDENGTLNNSVAINDSDVDGDALTFSVQSGAANGTLQLNADGSFTYTPLPEYFGADSFTYTAADGNGLTDTATVAIDILRAADVPTQVIHEANVAENETLIPLSIQSLLAGFVNTEVLTVTVAGVPSGASLNNGVDNGNGSYTLQPANLVGLAITLPAGTAGTVPLTVTTIADDGGPISTQTATLNINFGAAGEPEIVTGLGGDRDDNIVGGAANDFLSGGSGSDLLQGNNGDDVITGGIGDDLARYNDLIENYSISTINGADYLVTDLHLTSGFGNDGTDQLAEIESLLAANFTGNFTGPAINGALQMSAGNDIAIGYGSNVTVDYTGAVVGSAGITLNLSQADSGNQAGTSQSGNDVLRNILNITGSEFNDNITGNAAANILSGGDGNDILQGNLGDDTIVGDAGHDRARYNDLIQNYDLSTSDGAGFTVTDLHVTSGFGDDGTDQLTQTEGLQTANFTGDFTAPAVGGVLQMTSGNDVAVGYGANVTVDYTGAVVGSAGITLNLSQADSGNQAGTSQSGNDVLRNILNITGSEFNDNITGNAAANILSGGDGNDILQGNHGDDTIIGNAGHDLSRYNDLIENYAIATSDGADFTVTDLHMTSGFGDDGTDQLTQTEGLQTANFTGDFTAPAVGGVLQMTSGNDVAVGYGANVTVDYTGAVVGSAGITLNLSQADSGNQAGTSQSGNDVLRNILNITGSEFNDNITGNAAANILSGGDGNDILQGNLGDDTIVGDAGHDRARYNDLIQNYGLSTSDGAGFTVTDLHVTSGFGDDGTDQLTQTEGLQTANFTGDFTAPAVGGVLQMTSGNDVAVGYGANVTVDYTGAVVGSAGITLNLSQADSGNQAGTSQSGNDVLRNILNITGSEFNDNITGNAAANILSGGDGNDILQGNLGDDTIVGDAGHDRARYNDLIQNYELSTSDGLNFEVTDLHLTSGFGDDGTDQLLQTEGLQTANFTGDFVQPAVGGIFQMSSGNDIVVSYAGNDTVNYAGAVVGTNGISINLAQAASGNQAGTSQSGNDVLRGIVNIIGSEFNDSITGDATGNLLNGGTGNDSLFGGDGDDELIGGVGDDTLFGQFGNDRFLFADGDGTDSVIGFSHGSGSEDVIDFAGVTTLSSFGDVQANAIQQGANTEISYSGGTVVLVGVALVNLHADDFSF